MNLTADLIFPAVEMNLAASYGDYLRIVGGYYSQHFAHAFGTSNYLDYSQFQMSATRSSSLGYRQMNLNVLNNLKTVLDKSEADEECVNVIVKGTTHGTITDFDGNFSLNVSHSSESASNLRLSSCL